MSSKYVVCPKCEGEGYVSKLGAFTGADLDEWYGDSDERYEFIEQYTERGGIYDERCPFCRGQRVVESAGLEERLEYEAELAAEARWGY
jgi:hypothetical protein